MIVAGGGAKDASAALVSLAETLDAPVVLTGNAKGVVPSRHPLCAENTLVFGRIQRDIEAAVVVWALRPREARLREHLQGELSAVAIRTHGVL